MAISEENTPVLPSLCGTVMKLHCPEANRKNPPVAASQSVPSRSCVMS